MRWILLAAFAVVSSADAAAACRCKPVRGAVRAAARVAATAPGTIVRDVVALPSAVVREAAVVPVRSWARPQCLGGCGAGR